MEHQDITLGVVVGWAWAAFFVVLGVTMVAVGDVAAGACAILSALVALPPLGTYIQSLWHVSFTDWLRLFVAIGLMLAGASLLGFTSGNLTLPSNLGTDSHPTSTQASSSEPGQSDTNPVGSSSPGPGSPNKNLDATGPTEDAATPTESAPTSGDSSTTGAAASPSGTMPAVPPQDSLDAVVPSAMQPRFGNTLISRTANAEWHLYYNSDGTFTGTETHSNYRVTGTWQVVGGNVCLTFQPPLPSASNPDCKPVTSHQVGDTWVSDGDIFSLIPGIQ
jgi:hypothetical protein